MQHDALSLCFEGVNLNHRAEHDQIVRRKVTDGIVETCQQWLSVPHAPPG